MIVIRQVSETDRKQRDDDNERNDEPFSADRAKNIGFPGCTGADAAHRSAVTVYGETGKKQTDHSRLRMSLQKHDQSKCQRDDRPADTQIFCDKNDEHAGNIGGQPRPECIQDDCHRCGGNSFSSAEMTPEGKIMPERTAKTGVQHGNLSSASRSEEYIRKNTCQDTFSEITGKRQNSGNEPE